MYYVSWNRDETVCRYILHTVENGDYTAIVNNSNSKKVVRSGWYHKSIYTDGGWGYGITNLCTNKYQE